MPSISVIMPIYNTKPSHLKSAITSILEQTHKDFEFLILNDSPENKTLKQIVKSYQDPRIKYLENKTHSGIAKSYNTLLNNAQSPYIALMNHDDISLPKRLEAEVRYLNQNQDIGLVGTAYKKFGKLNRFKTVYPPKTDVEIRSLMLFKSPIHHPTVMFRNTLVKEHNICYDESLTSLNDRKFFYDLAKVTKLSNLPIKLYKYRFHKDMTSKTHKHLIATEQAQFHKLWFKDNKISLTPEELFIFENYFTNGRCRIKDDATIINVYNLAEFLVRQNQIKHFAPIKEFTKVCSKYLEKRCLNAAFYGKISTKKLLNQTELPVSPPLLLNLANFALSTYQTLFSN